jgi:diphthamide biosynthesis methyltransferase
MEKKMKTDKFGIEIKVGDFVYIDSYTGMEFGTSAGTIQQIKKIGTKRIHFDSGHTNLRKAQFEFITKYTLIGMEKKTEKYGTFYFPLFVRTSTNDEMYNSIVSKLKKGADKLLSEALIKNENHRYENLLGNYKLRNSGYGFSVIWQEQKGLDFLKQGVPLVNMEENNA